MEGLDHFDSLPDAIILLIFNGLKDVKALIRCKSLSTRFNSLIPQTESLVLTVDRVVSEPDYNHNYNYNNNNNNDNNNNDDDDNGYYSFLSVLVRSVLKPLFELVKGGEESGGDRGQGNSPARILRGFERVKCLEIVLPCGDLRLDKGPNIRWSAEFGKSLRSCVILGFRSSSSSGEAELGGGGLKTRVVWTISALIAASARHYMVKELLKEHKHLERLVVRDREGEGTVVMDRYGLKECREMAAEKREWNNRTTVPAVRMRMRHEAKMELRGGERMEGATLVVVVPAGGVDTEGDEKHGGKNVGSVFEAFEGVYGEAVEKLLKSRSYLLEMNSF